MGWTSTVLLSLLAASLPLNSCTHVPLTGVPRELSYHYLTSARTDRSSAPSTLFAVTESDVLASVNPSTGQIAWRHQLKGIGGYEAKDDRVCAWQEHKVNCFEAVSGFLLWDHDFHHQDGSSVKGLKMTDDAVLAWDDQHLHTLAAASGSLERSELAPGIVGMLADNSPVATDASSGALLVYANGQPDGQPASAKQLASHAEQFVILDKGAVSLSSSGYLTPECPNAAASLLSSKHFKSSHTYTSIQRASGDHILALHSNGHGQILKLMDDCSLDARSSFNDAAPDAVYASSIDRNGDVHVARLTFSKMLKMGMITIYSSTKTDWGEKGYIQGSTLPVNTAKQDKLSFFAVEVAPPDINANTRPSTVSRSVWVTGSGQVGSSFGGAQTPAWMREEGLASLASDVEPVWLDVSKERLNHAIPPHETFIEQVQRHAGLLTEYLTALPNQVTSYLLGKTAASTDPGMHPLTAQFGFKKLAIVASDKGSIFALDMMTKGPPLDLGTTHVVWKNLIAPVSGDDEGEKLRFTQMQLSGKKLLVLGSKPSGQTLAWELDAQTGKLISERTLSDKSSVSFDVPDSAGQLALGAANQEHKSSLFSVDQTPSAPFVYTVQAGRSIQGWQAQQDPSKAASDVLLWTFSLPSDSDETVYSMVSQRTGEVGSLGRIMGNRSTLYKYLNPNVFLLTTICETKSSASLYLIDAVSGNTVWYTRHVGEVETSGGIQATLTENWLVYAFQGKYAPGKASRVVSVELYEDWEPKHLDPKGKAKKKVKYQGGKNMSSFDLRDYPLYESRSFIAPFSIKSMSTSSTRLGVTTKSLLVVTDTDALMSIPRPVLDPRRPLGTPTKSEQEERLMPYDPLVPLEPKWTVSERALVMSSSNPIISSTSTLLESTSLVLQAGLDLFCDRVAPSGTFDLLREDFNKVQLLLTMGALALGVSIAKPLAERKRLRSQWYTS